MFPNERQINYKFLLFNKLIFSNLETVYYLNVSIWMLKAQIFKNKMFTIVEFVSSFFDGICVSRTSENTFDIQSWKNIVVKW